MTSWIFLLTAIVFEVFGTVLLKLSDGFEKPIIGMASMGVYTVSFFFLAPALKTIPVGIAYAIWSGVGIVAITTIGVFSFGQRLDLMQYLFIALILVGALGLRLTTEG